MNQNYNDYQQNQYQPPYQNNFQPQPPVNPGKGLGIAGFVLSIISFIGCFIGGVYVGLPTSIIGIILSGIGMSKSKQVGMGNGLGVAGLVISIIMTVFYIVCLILVLVGASILADYGIRI